MNAENSNIPFLDKEKIIGWFDIVKGLGDLALHSLFDAIHREARPSDSEHYLTDSVSPERYDTFNLQPYDYDGVELPPGWK